ncbi:hypothetical protein CAUPRSCDRAFT_10785 [Caulochytrium protostelioides]|uniref:Uncharacterized protein n=1 Tax=Caulochytrium protostelioides TaxID=1555241 RepID=A0A4P9WVZ7_9FUNG|nr:hypothetical protein CAUPRSCDRAFT_10785 [Caulochytrium protostelioides]
MQWMKFITMSMLAMAANAQTEAGDIHQTVADAGADASRSAPGPSDLLRDLPVLGGLSRRSFRVRRDVAHDDVFDWAVVNDKETSLRKAPAANAKILAPAAAEAPAAVAAPAEAPAAPAAANNAPQADDGNDENEARGAMAPDGAAPPNNAAADAVDAAGENADRHYDGDDHLGPDFDHDHQDHDDDDLHNDHHDDHHGWLDDDHHDYVHDHDHDYDDDDHHHGHGHDHGWQHDDELRETLRGEPEKLTRLRRSPTPPQENANRDQTQQAAADDQKYVGDADEIAHDSPVPGHGPGKGWENNHGYGHDGYGHDGYGHDDLGHDGHGHDGYGHDGYGHDGYGHDGYGHDYPGHNWKNAPGRHGAAPAKKAAPVKAHARLHARASNGDDKHHGYDHHGYDHHGDEHHGDEHHGDEHHGVEHHGDEHHGDEHHGYDHHGDEHHGDEHHGDEHHGDEHHGDEHHGDEHHGDEYHGDEHHGDWNDDGWKAKTPAAEDATAVHPEGAEMAEDAEMVEHGNERLHARGNMGYGPRSGTGPKAPRDPRLNRRGDQPAHRDRDHDHANHDAHDHDDHPWQQEDPATRDGRTWTKTQLARKGHKGYKADAAHPAAGQADQKATAHNWIGKIGHKNGDAADQAAGAAGDAKVNADAAPAGAAQVQADQAQEVPAQEMQDAQSQAMQPQDAMTAEADPTVEGERGVDCDGDDDEDDEDENNSCRANRQDQAGSAQEAHQEELARQFENIKARQDGDEDE